MRITAPKVRILPQTLNNHFYRRNHHPYLWYLSGGGKKSNSKDNTRRYDKKEQDPLMHAARLADPNYAPKGSGFYKDRNGVKHLEKK